MGAFQPLAFVEQIERFNLRFIGVVGVLENPHVDTDAPLGVLRLLRRVVRGFDAEDGVPLPGRVLLDGDGLDFSVVGQVAVESDMYVSEFREPQSRSATRVLA